MPSDSTPAQPLPSRELGREYRHAAGKVVISKATPLTAEQIAALRGA